MTKVQIYSVRACMRACMCAFTRMCICACVFTCVTPCMSTCVEYRALAAHLCSSVKKSNYALLSQPHYSFTYK